MHCFQEIVTLTLASLSAAKHINPDYAYKGLARIGEATCPVFTRLNQEYGDYTSTRSIISLDTEAYIDSIAVLRFRADHSSLPGRKACSPGELCHVIAMFTGAVSHKLLRRFSGYGSRVPSGYAFSCADAIHFRVQPSHPNTWEEKRLRGQIGYRRPMRFRVVASTPARGHAGAVLAGGGQRTREEGCWPEERQDPLGRRDIYMFAISWPNSRMPESRGTTAWTREGIMSYQLFSIECDYSTQ
nr:uncharacterized protein LOC127295645 isoform X9 [Lolium perenne]